MIAASRKNRWLAWALPFALALASGGSASGAGEDERVVARDSGGRPVLTVGVVEGRLAALSPDERATFGAQPVAIARAFVERELALEFAAEQEARARRVDKSVPVADRTRELLRQAMDRALQRDVLAKKPVTPDEVRAYFEANREKFELPPRVRVWRILVNDEPTAARVLEEARKTPTPTKWSELTRQHSIDKATHMRQGDLGFVRPDGSTDVPRVRVNPALFEAANAVRDGELVPKPVDEGGKFAVIWRRGSLPKRARTLEQEEPSIRQLLERRRVDDARKALLKDLRAEHAKDEKPELLELVPEGLIGANAAGSGRPSASVSARPARAGSEPPKATERGLR